MSTNAVVFLGMTYPHGIIRHFALLAVEIEKTRVAQQPAFDFFFASTDGETGQNAWPMVRETFAPDRILVDSDFQSLVGEIAKLANRYQRVIVHTGGGWGQTKHFLRARKLMDPKFRSRLCLVGTTHSYRHDSIHRLWMSAFQAILYWFCYDKIIFQCQDAADRFVGSSLLFHSGKGVVIPLGCEAFPAPVEAIPDSIQKAGISDVLADTKIFKFIYLAQFRPGKMHEWLVRAMAPVLDQHKKVCLIFCGMGDETVIQDVRETASRLGVASQVLMPGQIPRYDVPWLLAHVNAAVVPSRAETFGHNFIEPMFAKLPVLGTCVGIGKEVIEDGETGYAFSLGRPEKIRAAAEKMIQHPEDVVRMGQKAYRRVATSFRHSDVARQLVDLYLKLMSHDQLRAGG